ncbi:MAG: hypothetical protein M5U34_40325 [Chloroflexi bacterium]|nr:hypothetical protein [Chloroflexota bacterium]
MEELLNQRQPAAITPPMTAPVAQKTAVAESDAPPNPADRKLPTFIWTQEFDTLSPLYTGVVCHHHLRLVERRRLGL